MVNRIDEDVPFKERNWEVIGKDEDGENKYGYVYADSTKNVTTPIYEQTVENLDMTELVKIVNGVK